MMNSLVDTRLAESRIPVKLDGREGWKPVGVVVANFRRLKPKVRLVCPPMQTPVLTVIRQRAPFRNRAESAYRKAEQTHIFNLCMA